MGVESRRKDFRGGKPFQHRGFERIHSLDSESPRRNSRHEYHLSLYLVRNGLAGVWSFCDRDCIHWGATRSGAKSLAVYVWNDCLRIGRSVCIAVWSDPWDSNLLAAD